MLPIAAAAATGIFVGSTIVATRFVIDQTAPASLALLRYAIGFCCLLTPTWFAGRVRFERRDLLPIGLLGIMQFGIVVTLLNFSLQFIPSARAALIFATMPMITMILSAALGYEQLTPTKTIGVLLTIVGVGFALGGQVVERGTGVNAWLGELSAFGSAFCAAVCSVWYRPYLRKYAPLPVSAFAMLASVIFLAGLAFGEGFFAAPPHFTLGGWLAVGFIGVSSGVGYYLWLWALSRTSPTNVAVFLALSPITATGVGVLWLAERISTTFLIGLIGVALGLWLAHRR
jgi:drug/metabolite transporter (DMT)-like permease